MAQALPRIGWIEASRTARGLPARVGPGDPARIDRLCEALAPATVAASPAKSGAWTDTRRLRPMTAAATRPYVRAVAMLGLISAGILALAPHAPALRGSLPTRGLPARFDSIRSRGDGAMRGSVVAGVLSAGLVAGSALAQDAVQWRVEDGGNGHWYRVDSTQRAWTASREYAESVGGYLVTITSLVEQNFVEELPGVEEEGCAGPAIGLTQSPIGAEPGGGWSWITGEPLVFTAWGRIGSQINPDDSVGDPPNGTVDRGALWCPPWHDWDDCLDSNDYTIAAIIEWSADCNSDGIVDYGQIRTGELEDTNANNIPDCCEQGVPCSCPADIDANGVVNAIDLAVVISYWGTDGGKDYPEADIDGSGTIDGADLAAVLGNWGPCE